MMTTPENHQILLLPLCLIFIHQLVKKGKTLEIRNEEENQKSKNEKLIHGFERF